MTNNEQFQEDLQDMPFDTSEEEQKAACGTRADISDSIKSVEKEDFGLDEVNKRNIELTRMLTSFVDEYKTSIEDAKPKREAFYKLSIAILVAVVAVNIALVFVGIFAGIDTETAIALFAYAITTTVSSIVTIPIIIAKHLFPTERDTRIIEVLKSLVTTDCQIRELNNDKEKPYDEEDLF